MDLVLIAIGEFVYGYHLERTDQHFYLRMGLGDYLLESQWLGDKSVSVHNFEKL